MPLLFLYVNRPCVVLGRFQNPWIETHLPYLAKEDIWLVRRQSGGGCVFHDEGNLNYCFMVPGGMIERRKHADLIVNAFKKAEIELQVSPRIDLWLADSEGSWKKISGSAYKQTKDASFHHGTFLVSSDLEKLEESLKHTIAADNSKSIASVRSKVITLQERFPMVEITDVIEILAHELKTVPEAIGGDLLSQPSMQESFQNLTKWEWLWGETPAFEFQGMKIHKGIVKEPFEEKFSRENMLNKLSQTELDRLFPDFSNQYQEMQKVF